MRKQFNKQQFESKVNDFIDKTISDVFGVSDNLLYPKCNQKETDTQYIFEFAVPGVSKSEISLHLEDGKLNISKVDKVTDEKQAIEVNMLKQEFKMKNFSRSIKLPDQIDVDSIKAKCKNGLLVVKFGKLKNSDWKAKNVEIK